MKDLVHYGFILGLICMIASGLLAGVNSLTKERIAEQAFLEQQRSLKEVMPEGENFEAVKSGEDILYYKVTNKAGSLIGFAFKARAKGYSSQVETLAGLKSDGTISAIKVISQSETPGLGTRITEPEFSGQYKNRPIAAIAQVDAIAGATISSRAVINSLKQKAEEIGTLVKNER